MARLGARLKGDDQLMALLTQLPGRVASKVNRAAVTKATTPILNAVKGRVPVASGLLRKSMVKKVTNRKTKAKGIIGASSKVTGPNGEQPFRYDHLVEFGHVAPDGTVVPPNPFMREGWEQSEATARTMYAAAMADGIEAEARKLGGG